MSRSVPSVQNSCARELGPSLADVRDELAEAIAEAYRRERATLVDALPGMGKSHTAIKVAASTDTPLAFLTSRGHEEQYEQLLQWCADEGLDGKRLPSFEKDCPTAAGDHDPRWEERVGAVREAGVSAGELHKHGADWFGRELPCQAEGECPYTARWREVEDADVVVGHYLHAHVPSVREGRVVVLDEFPGTVYLETVGSTAITRFLERHGGLPFEDHDALLRGRRDDETRREALEWFRGQGMDLRDVEGAVENAQSGGHALAPLAVFTLLKSEPAIAGWEAALLGGKQAGVHAKVDKRRVGFKAYDVGILNPPDFSDAEGLVALDGTPTRRLWNLALGVRLKRRKVLSDEERRAYIRDTQGLRVIQTSEYDLPYSSGEYVKPRRDAALIHEVARKHGEKPGVITSQAAKRELESMDGVPMLEASAETYYGNFKGSNKLADAQAGVVLGSPHRSDHYVELWSAIAGEEVREEREPGESYGDFGDMVLQHMRENEVAQAIFRFAREGDGATVYVHTGAIPGWMPINAGPEECEVEMWTSRQQQAIGALKLRGPSRVSEIAEAMEINITRQGAWNIGKRLVDEGIAQKRDDPNHAQAELLELTEPDETNPYGTVTLPEVSDGNRKEPRTRPCTDLFTVTRGNLKERERWRQENAREARESRQKRWRRMDRQLGMERWRRGEL